MVITLREYQEFLERLKNHMDPDGRSNMNEIDASDLIELARRLQVQDASSSIDPEDIRKLLKDEEFRDNLSQAARNFTESQSKELDEDA